MNPTLRAAAEHLEQRAAIVRQLPSTYTWETSPEGLAAYEREAAEHDATAALLRAVDSQPWRVGATHQAVLVAALALAAAISRDAS